MKLALFLVICTCCAATFGAAPAVKRLHPAGGQRGHTADVTATGDFSRWPVEIWTSHAGVKVTCGEDKGKLNVAVDETAPLGACLVRLYDSDGTSRPIPFVVGNLPEIVEKASNDAPLRAEELPESTVTVNGRLEKRDDVDVYSVQLEEGQTVVASVVANETLASPMDAVLQVLSADGFVLAQNDDWNGLDPQIVYSAPSAGKYLVRIFAFPAQADSRIGLAGGDDFLYRLTITTGPFADFCWPLAVREQTATEVELVGWNVDERIKRQTITAAGNPFSIDVDKLSGQREVSVEPHACPTEVEPNGPAQSQALELPATVSGRLEATSDTDVFRFKAKSGEQYLFTLEGRSLGSPIDGVLEVTDASGKSLARADDTDKRRDPALNWKAPVDSEYQIAVSDLHRHGGARFFYRLRAVAPSADFRIKSPEHAFVGTVGKPLEISLEVDRQYGFEQEIAIQIEGLPDTVVVEPVASMPKGATAKKVALKLTGSQAFSGPFRIAGKAKGDGPLERAAMFDTPGFGESSDLWITFRAEDGK
jgi:hypothetical protein